MKTSNVEGHGSKATDATRGRRSALVAGSKGMMWRDASTESVGQVRDMTVYGAAEFVDHEDGTGDLIIGGSSGPGPGGGSGGDTGAASIAIQMLNNSGVNLDVGAVVVVDDTADDAVTTTTTATDTQIVGVVMEPIEAGAIGPVLFNGYTSEVDVTGAVVRGDYLETSTTAGVGQASATREAGTFGVVTAGADITEFVADSAITEQDSSVTSLAITMPASVTDPDSAGRLLFLALWRDPSVTSNPTITGWTRIGSTSGFWYYYRVCTVGDTASATWTGSTPAAAIVALLDPVVASIEDSDFGASAAVTGLDGTPHYALAALQGAVAVPAGWTALPSAAIAFDPGGVTDLALAGTVTNDPANTMDWLNPTRVNDGNESTYAEFLPHAAGETFRLKMDLGSAGTVSESWVRTAYAMDLEYSTDDITYNALPGVNWAPTTTHNGFPTYRRVTWTGGDVTARYWRLGRTSAGSGSGETISTWELTGTHDLNVEGMLVGKYVGRDTSIASPFVDDSAVIALNLHVEPKPAAILYGPDLGGAGSVSEILDIPTAETDTTLRLAPDGAGGVEWAVTTGSGLPWFVVTDAAYGATNDGTTDDTAAINSAIAALVAAGSGVLYFPGGAGYKVTGALTALSVPCLVMGDGGHGAEDGTAPLSQILCTSQTAIVFTTTSPNVSFRDISGVNTYAGTPTAGAFIKATDSRRANYENVYILGFYDNIHIENSDFYGDGWRMDGCHIEGPVRYGARLQATYNVDAGDSSISNTWFGTHSYNADAALRIESGGGIKITNCKINMNAAGDKRYVHGIDLAVATTVSTSILLVTNTSIENVSGDGIHGTTSAATSKWGHVQVKNCQFGLFSNTTGKCISLVATTAGDFYDCIISGNTFKTGSTARSAVQLTKCDNVYIDGNTLQVFNGQFTATTCTNIRPAWTAFPTTPITNEQFYRTDGAVNYSYDGTRWICTCAHYLPIGLTDASILPLSATQNGSHRAALPVVPNTRVYKFTVSFFVSGGTALSGSHKWVIVLKSGASGTTLGTANIDSGASSVWRSLSVTVDANVAPSEFEYELNSTKTGTPGNLYLTATIDWRIVNT